MVSSGCRSSVTSAPGEVSSSPAVSRLAQERSPYLRQHADNAVDWYPWGDEAFAKAKAEGKPVFLSVGYSTCHWCHVMEEESFMNPAVGKMLNEHFVPIKVDRETRPDIDRLYMGFLLSTTGSGGWPMSVFLTPDAQPFLAGTYYPEPAKYDRIGFLDLLTQVSRKWESDPKSWQQDAAIIAQRMQEASRLPASGQTPDARLVRQALDQLEESYDQELGGFGGAPKFPQAALLSFLLDHGVIYPKSDSETMTLRTLEAIALGGIRDHLEGGFHRYSTDRSWRVPHFEKMLSDQAQLLSLYSRAFALTGKPLFRDAAESIVGYLQRRMTLEHGGLATAEDADSPLPGEPTKHAEGAYYVWSEAEVEQVLDPSEKALVGKLFGLQKQGNAGEALTGKNVLAIANSNLLSNPGVAPVLKKMEAARQRRPRPHRDDKALTGWNAMAAGALAEASVALKRPDLAQRASALMEFLESSLVVDGRLLRSRFDGQSEIDAFASDHAEMVAAYLALYQASGRPRHLRRAVHWQRRQDDLFADATQGGYFETAAKHGLLFRDKELQDGAVPCTASRSALNLVRLYRLTGEQAYRTRYEGLLRSVAAVLEASPQALPGVLAAIDLSEGPEESVVLVGQRPQWWGLLQDGYHPQRTLQWLATPTDSRLLAPLVPYVASLPPEAAVYFCQNFACGIPITSTEELKKRLRR